MKKIILFLFAFNFLIAKAQTPGLTFTNVTGSSSLTCATHTINILASVSNYTNGPLTYTWVGLSSSLSGTNVNITTADNYTITAFNTANSFNITQSLSITNNTTIPTVSISVSDRTLTCFTPTAIAQASSTNANLSYTWNFPGPGTAFTNTILVSVTNVPTNTSLGTYSLMITDNANACTNSTTISLYQNISPPIALVSGPSTTSCATPTVVFTSNSISNMSPNFPNTITVINDWYGPVPQASLSSSTYTAYTAGVYTLVAIDLNNGCSSIITKTLSLTGNPQVSSPVPFNINCPTPSVSIFPTITGATSGLTYSWTVPATASVSAYNTHSIITNSPGVYTVTVFGSVPSCYSTTLITVAVCAGIHENYNSITISIYPNPANDILNIKLSSEINEFTKIEIINALGQIVKEEMLTQNNEINIKDLPNGIYFLNLISDKQGDITKRFIISH